MMVHNIFKQIINIYVVKNYVQLIKKALDFSKILKIIYNSIFEKKSEYAADLFRATKALFAPGG